MKRIVSALCAVVSIGFLPVVLSTPAEAGTRPSVTALSKHKATYWGGQSMTVSGRNFTHVTRVLFGATRAGSVHVVSPSRLTVRVPWHGYGRVHVRVVTRTGMSSRTEANWFTFTRPTMGSHIQGGLTGNQEKSISAQVRRSHHGVRLAPRSSRWTAAMGVSALQRARSWMGLPYSWAGGNGSGPTTGVCAHNGGDLDCHIAGFDCSGLTLYAWWPYKHLAHFAATQRSQAGRFHPAIGQLMPGDLVFFSGYISGGIGHVAIYEGNGNVIEAEQSGTVIHRARLSDVIRASGTYRGATRPMSVGRQGAVPAVTSMTTQVSTSGGYVTINGSNLATTTSVTVSGKLYYGFAQRTSTRLVVKVPAHAVGRGGITVSNPWGSVARSLAYVGKPTLTSLSAARGVTTGATSVTVSGTNLTAISRVTLDATAVRYASAGPNRLTITMPAHSAGPVAVTVWTRFGRSNAKVFTYFVATPPASTPPTPPTSAPPGRPASTRPSTGNPPASTTPSSTTPPTTTPPTTTPPTSSSPASSPPSSEPSSVGTLPSADTSSTTATGGAPSTSVSGAVPAAAAPSGS